MNVSADWSSWQTVRHGLEDNGGRDAEVSRKLDRIIQRLDDISRRLDN